MNRFWELDALRGLAIVLMVFFHFLWDLNFFGFTSFELYSWPIVFFQITSAGIFLILVGVSLTISYNRSKNNYLQRFVKRAMLIFGAGLLITAFTTIFFPNAIIFFGILHLIGTSILLSVFFVNKKKLSFVAGIFIIALDLVFKVSAMNINELFWVGFGTPISALDFYPLIPWFGVILIGIFLGNTFYPKGKAIFEIKKPEIKGINFIQLLGKKSFIIYFLHQPLLFGVLYFVSFII